jgi:lysophospholipase L1-like esterase
MTLRRLRLAILLAVLCGLAIASRLPAGEPAEKTAASPFDKWEKEIRAFEEADKLHPPPQGAVLVIGSSGVRLWKTLAEDFPEYKMINRGFGGSHIADSVHFADRIVIPYKPRLIILRAGGNDINAGKSPEQVLADFTAFVEKVRSQLPQTRIAFMTINPSPARWANVDRERRANELIRKYVAEHDNLYLDYIDSFTPMLNAEGKPREELFAKDRLHNNADGYKLWVSIVRPHLKEAAK